MDPALILFTVWFSHIAIGLALVWPILFFGRKRIGWAAWELLALVIPYWLWAALMLSPLSTGRKSLANLLSEPIYIIIAMAVLALVRVAVGRKLSERAYAFSFITVLCLVAVGIFFMVPFIPE